MREFKLVEREGWYIENIGLYRGHLYAVTFLARIGTRCGYVLLNDDDTYNLDDYEDIVNAHGGITLTETDASHLFQESDLMHHRIIGWDYNHCFDGQDVETSQEYATMHPELHIDNVLSMMKNICNSINERCHVYTCDEVTEDCMSVIDDIVYHRDTGRYLSNSYDEEDGDEQ